MRSFFVFALLALTGVRAQGAERIFVEGKGVPNLAASTGSSTTTTQLIQAALAGSGSILSQYADDPNKYHNADANTFSIKPTTGQSRTTVPHTSSRPPPPPPATPATEPASAPEQEITLNGFTVPELSSSTSLVPSTAAPSTTTATMTASTVPTKTEATTAVPTTTTTTTTGPTTTKTTTTVPTITTTIFPTTTTTTVAQTTTTTVAITTSRDSEVDRSRIGTVTTAPSTTTIITTVPTTTATDAPTTTKTASTTTTASPITSVSTIAAVPTKSTSMTAPPTTTTTTAVPSTTTTTTTATPTTTKTRTTTLTTSMTTAAPRTTMTITATTATAAAPTKTTKTMANPATTTTAAPNLTTTSTTVPTTTTTTTSTTTLSTASSSTTASAKENSQVVTLSTTIPTTTSKETTTAEAPTRMSAASSSSTSPLTATTSRNPSKASSAATIVSTIPAPITSSTEAVTATTEVSTTTSSTEAVIATTAVPNTSTTESITSPAESASSVSAMVGTAHSTTNTTDPTTPASRSGFAATGVPSTTTPRTDTGDVTIMTNPISPAASGLSNNNGAGSSASLASPELAHDGTKDMVASETNTDNGSGTEPVFFNPEPDFEDLEPSPSSNGEVLDGAPVIGTAVNSSSPSSPRSPMSEKSGEKSGPSSTPKKAISVSATGSTNATATFAGSGSAVVSAAVINDSSKETETMTIVVTPVPEEAAESSDETSTTEESADVSPESEFDSGISKPLIPKGPGRPRDIPLPTGDAADLVEADAVDSTTSSNPKILITEGLEALFNEESVENAASPEPDGMTLPEPSSEPRMPITSAVGSMQDLLPSSEETALTEPPVESSDSAEALPFAALADSLSSSFGNHDNIGPVPIPSMEVEFGDDGPEVLDALEPTFIPFDVGEFLNSMEEDMRTSDEAEMSAEPEISAEPERFAGPEMSVEPEASSEELLPSGEMGILGADLIVKHPVSLDPSVIAEEIRLISDEVTTPMQWTEVGLFLVSSLSKFVSALSVVRQAEDISTFELNMRSTCLDPSGCESELKTYKKFVRDGRMDENLRAQDMDDIKVYLKGDVIDNSSPARIDATASDGLNAGIIAGIAIGAVAGVSLLVYGVLFVAKRGYGGNGGYDAERGRIESYQAEPNEQFQTQNAREKEGTFMISNFGGSPRNTEALIPWMSNSSSEGSTDHEQESSSSFITVDTAETTEITTNNLSNYRFEETTSSGSESDFENLDVEDVPDR